MRPIITLLTDFGTADGYVGEMKGMLLSLVSGVELVDITHDIPPQDVHAGRLTLARVWRRFPSGTLHIVVVDPGVGSDRAGLAVTSDEHILVGPDNGVLSPALLMAGACAIELPVPPSASTTFHGRDVFVPAAAALARGEPLDSLGVQARDPIVLRTVEPVRDADGSLAGEVILIDRFGNALTNLIGLRGGTIEVESTQIPLRRTYAEVAVGSPVAVVGSSGFIEIAVRDGDAAHRLGLTRGTRVVLRTSR
ncbi:MAG TPA: SAM-dependent chlorinase/fluorinase [Gemmatimonadaceae bacterium]|nr:SAM-dependent chlorinase/fluorinase [Gemmatimonadaceae bacterium]